jgi:hypothetical protein
VAGLHRRSNVHGKCSSFANCKIDWVVLSVAKDIWTSSTFLGAKTNIWDKTIFRMLNLSFYYLSRHSIKHMDIFFDVAVHNNVCNWRCAWCVLVGLLEVFKGLVRMIIEQSQSIKRGCAGLVWGFWKFLLMLSWECSCLEPVILCFPKCPFTLSSGAVTRLPLSFIYYNTIQDIFLNDMKLICWAASQHLSVELCKLIGSVIWQYVNIDLLAFFFKLSGYDNLYALA